MKKIIFCIILMPIMMLNAQDGEIIYKTTFLKKRDNPNEMFKKTVKEINALTFSLRYNTERSYFENIRHVPLTDELTAKSAMALLHAPLDWQQTVVGKQSFYNNKISGKTYMVNFNKMENWELTNETKKIQDYTCFKAIFSMRSKKTGKTSTFEAWYSPEIPVPYGPIGYGGLPGLILELKRPGRFSYVASKIVLNPKKGIKKMPVPSLENPINVTEMSRLMRAARKVTKD